MESYLLLLNIRITCIFSVLFLTDLWVFYVDKTILLLLKISRDLKGNIL